MSTTTVTLLPSSAAATSANTTPGMTWNRSDTFISTVSASPPRYPATPPTTTAIERHSAPPTAAPTSSDTWPPVSSLAKRSRPSESVAMG